MSDRRTLYRSKTKGCIGSFPVQPFFVFYNTIGNHPTEQTQWIALTAVVKRFYASSYGGNFMKTAVESEPQTALADMITSKMEEQGKTAKELAETFDVTYEHIRRIVRGEGIPSKFVLKMFADELDIPYKDLERVAVADKLRKKYGSIPAELAGKDPTLEPLERVWGKLTHDQQAALIDMATSFQRRNRVAKAS